MDSLHRLRQLCDQYGSISAVIHRVSIKTCELFFWFVSVKHKPISIKSGRHVRNT